MSKAPKRPSQREGLKRWDNEGGAPRSGHPSHEPHLAPAHEAEPALYYFNLRTESGLIKDPEGDTYSSLKAAFEDAVAKARDLIVEGKQKGEDRRGWGFEIMGRANQPVLRSHSQRSSIERQPDQLGVLTAAVPLWRTKARPS
jgi:hypothetical protein